MAQAKLGVADAAKAKAATPKPKKAGKKLAPVKLERGITAEVTPKKSIRLSGEMARWNPKDQVDFTVEYDRTFEIGDSVEYDSYNLSYIGTIVAITAKTVTVDKGWGDGEVKRMKLQDFGNRNWNLDLEDRLTQNAMTSYTL